MSFFRSRYKYINGNYLVTGYYGGIEKRAFRVNEELNPVFPDSIDLKITNKCSTGCPFCHENSRPDGEEAIVSNTISVLDKLPKVGIELAIGGGNIFESFSVFEEIVFWAKDYFSLAVTINAKDVLKNIKFFKNSVFFNLSAIGISVSSIDEIRKVIESDLFKFRSFEVVFHIVIGVFPVKELEELLVYDKIDFIKSGNNELVINSFGVSINILLLGFKLFGRGLSYTPSLSNLKLDEYEKVLKKRIDYMKNSDMKGDKILVKKIAFDNLAIKQLNIKPKLSKKDWSKFYMGDEFSCSMYIDAVNEVFAPTSHSSQDQRVSWKDMDILEFFKKHR